MNSKNQDSKELFRHHLKRIRKNRGFNQVELARKLNVKPSSISNYETGVSFPDFQIIDSLIEILQTSRAELFGEVEVSKVEEPDESYGRDIIDIIDDLEIKYPGDKDQFSLLRKEIIKMQLLQVKTDQKLIALYEQTKKP